MAAAKGAKKKSVSDDSETIILRLTIRKNASPAAHNYLSSLEKSTRARHVLELLTQAQVTDIMRNMLTELLEFQRSQREGMNDKIIHLTTMMTDLLAFQRSGREGIDNQFALLSALQKALTDLITLRQAPFFVQPAPSNGHVTSEAPPSADKERQWNSVAGGLHNALDFDINDGSLN